VCLHPEGHGDHEPPATYPLPEQVGIKALLEKIEKETFNTKRSR